jgi:hypothetical protein
MNITHIAALLTVTLTTNEVKLGTATIGTKTFDVVGLQAVTNRTVTAVGESWTNTYPGPFVATNLVPAKETGRVWSTNVMNWYPNLVISNLLYHAN